MALYIFLEAAENVHLLPLRNETRNLALSSQSLRDYIIQMFMKIILYNIHGSLLRKNLGLIYYLPF